MNYKLVTLSFNSIGCGLRAARLHLRDLETACPQAVARRLPRNSIVEAPTNELTS